MLLSTFMLKELRCTFIICVFNIHFVKMYEFFILISNFEFDYFLKLSGLRIGKNVYILIRYKILGLEKKVLKTITKV